MQDSEWIQIPWPARLWYPHDMTRYHTALRLQSSFLTMQRLAKSSWINAPSLPVFPLNFTDSSLLHHISRVVEWLDSTSGTGGTVCENCNLPKHKLVTQCHSMILCCVLRGVVQSINNVWHERQCISSLSLRFYLDRVCISLIAMLLQHGHLHPLGLGPKSSLLRAFLAWQPANFPQVDPTWASWRKNEWLGYRSHLEEEISHPIRILLES